MKHTFKGDLFTSVQMMLDATPSGVKVKHYIIHGCNAQGVMGSGFAKAIRQHYPEAYEYYRQIYEGVGLTLGQAVVLDCSIGLDSGVKVANLITQEFYGRTPNKTYVSYSAIEQALEDMMEFVYFDTAFGYDVHLHYPKIGAGLGGGDWGKIEAIIDKVVDGQYDQYLHLG